MYEYGKKILFVSFALLVGLLIAQRVLIQYLPQPQGDKGLSRADFLTTTSQTVAPGNNAVVSSQERAVDLAELSRNLGDSYLRQGKAVAIISSTDLYFVDRQGFLVDPAKAQAKYDLPVITGVSIKVDSSNFKVINKSIYEALNLIEIIRKANFVMHNQLSEVHITDSAGFVLYLSKPTLTAVFGKGELSSKVAYLATIIESLGQSDLLKKAAYLDFRHPGQVVVKKKNLS